METVFLWKSLQEENLKQAEILGEPIWQHSLKTLEKLGCECRPAKAEERELRTHLSGNRDFSGENIPAPQMPILYFFGYYPSLPEECLADFLSEAAQAKRAVLYRPSEKWREEREIVCILLQGAADKKFSVDVLEKTLAFPLQILASEADACKLEAEISLLRNQALIKEGVVIKDIHSTKVDFTAKIAPTAVLHPYTRILGKSQIGAGSHIGPNCTIIDAQIGEKNQVVQAQIEQSKIDAECNIGPFSYIRPNSQIGSRVRIGDFVEIKNAVIGEDTMISHLTYVGDADVGKRVNFGCGTVLVNFDGREKHRSRIEDDAFIGCNSNVVSPVHIGKGAFIAAGSTITHDLPADSLGIARVRQQIKENWVTNRKEINEGGKTNEQS
ncbi:MAG: DapH/DapD/GlmU-related protein [Eubacteriales bacterium]|nr:DapH/DapD/GlmU-related protein [Eubacteriales bacterium]